MTSADIPRLSVRSPGDLIATVPYLLGFHPADSVVVVAMRGKRITFAARSDLPDPAGPGAPGRPSVDPSEEAGRGAGTGWPAGEPGGRDGCRAEAARHLAAVVARQVVDCATVLGYGSAPRVTPAVDAVRTALAEVGIPVLDALRVTDGRYWSYLCVEPGCCPADGTPYDTGSSEVTAAAIFAGQVALPDRAALVARVAPVDGPERAALRQATERAGQRFADLLNSAPAADLLGGRAVRTAGRVALRAALRRYRRGERLDGDEVAWLSQLLTDVTVRDHAWEHTDGRDADIALWTDVLRRAEPELIAAPGALLAFAAWRAGHGSLAAVALERVLTLHPNYPLALLLDDLLRRGVPPSRLDGWPAVRTGGLVRRRVRGRRGRR